MTATIDETHDPAARSWVAERRTATPNFPIQNLPLGIFSPPGRRAARRRRDRRRDPRPARRIAALARLPAIAADAASGTTLNALFALGRRRRVAPAPAAVGAAVERRRRPRRRSSRMLHRGGATARCTCRPRSATTPISTSASITRPMSAGCSGPTIRCCPTTNMCRSAITAAPRRCGRPASPVVRPNGQRKAPDADAPSFGPTATARLRAGARRLDRPRQCARRRRSRSARRPTTSPASACSTTGRRATSRRGSISRSGRSSPRTSTPRSRPGW